MSALKVSDAIAQFLKDHEIRHVFGIIGSANSHIFDSIYNLGYTEIVCVHHEQAATMAMQTYYRETGKISAALVTAGGGSTNAITGVVSAWADSIPGVIISGQENVRFVNKMFDMRMWGIQGYDSADMVKKVTKYSSQIMEADKALLEVEKAFHIAEEGRPGPVWLDFPMDIQGAKLEADKYLHFVPEEKVAVSVEQQVLNIVELMKQAQRPVFWFGHGIRLSGAQSKIEKLLLEAPFPSLVTWAGIDMLDSDHSLNFGRAGVYGNRAANFVVQNADLVISIGTRMAIPMIGYEHSEFARDAKIVQVDIDQQELDKLEGLVDIPVCADANEFLIELIKQLSKNKITENNIGQWVENCNGYRSRYPLVGPENDDKNGYINSYRVVDKMSEYFKDDETVVTDMGTALLSAHQSLKLKSGQRLMTSTGLGEMGYGLPAAIGASFGKNKGHVVCLNCDGGIMMNLQELQTITHHKLPIKTFIFNNDGYLMIKHTQKNLFEGRYSATNKNSGVSCPDFSKVAAGFEMPYYSIKNWEEFKVVMPLIMESIGPVICEIFMDPEQYFYPKLSLAIKRDGTIVSPPLEDISPLLSREEFMENMIVEAHDKSKDL
ncbi:thiamine pyrophosphate-binding protein [Marinomonas pontica]|uniref:thiamine pyrophosphate-binding protein n=1 Tax=Marinomonas pontica TaxID=264739 RepID=UPI002244A6CB|nr:thiamine pyrophosphate-binding protein [Marinomonas pontica]MCW8354481.1 thiamine pyrophosphate-binding protein [Marinomonas pontica]